MSARKTVIAAMFVGVLIRTGYADVGFSFIRPPRVKRVPEPERLEVPNQEMMIIASSPSVKEAILMLPVRLAPAKGVAIPNPAVGGRKSASRSASRTIAAGIAISAAFASLIFMRRRRALALAGLLLAVGAVVFSVTTAEANVPPPFKSPPDPAPSPVLQTDPLTFAELIRNWSEKKLSEGDGQVKVIYSDTVDSITLMLPQGFDKPAAQEPEKPKSPRPLPKPEFKSQ